MQLALVMIFSLALAVPGLEGQDTWYSRYELAREKISASRWEEAVAHLERAIELKSAPELDARTYGVWRKDYLPYYHLGLAHFNLGHDQTALKYFKRSLAEVRSPVARSNSNCSATTRAQSKPRPVPQMTYTL